MQVQILPASAINIKEEENMAIFESKFNVGDKIFHLESLVRWANGAAKSIKLHEVKEVEVSTKATENGVETVVRYITDQGGYIVESEVVAEKDARAIAIQHLSARLSEVAAADLPADQQAN